MTATKKTGATSIMVLLVSMAFFASYGQQPKQPDDEMLFVAHRGASYLAPENTLASIRLAWELGADAAECDVMLTSDQQVVLFHDKTTGTLTGEDHVVRETSWEVLRNLDIRLKESNLRKYEGEGIPLLEEVLQTIPDDRMLVIEIKTGTEILPHLQQVLDGYWKSGRISFICFDFETILETKRLFPEVPCYFLSTFRSGVNRHFDEIIQGQLDGVDVRYRAINRKLVRRCRAAGLEVWCWTVNEPEAAGKMKALGVNAITTDRPKWLKEQI
ncbi:MAG TPA: glycerophosphodiester phosphodiesterase [Bacteroides sp.]|nr:glycerophosphodiester phosphodiesterase [Bacteroides sp.]